VAKRMLLPTQPSTTLGNDAAVGEPSPQKAPPRSANAAAADSSALERPHFRSPSGIASPFLRRSTCAKMLAEYEVVSKQR